MLIVEQKANLCDATNDAQVQPDGTKIFLKKGTGQIYKIVALNGLEPRQTILITVVLVTQWL